MGFFPATPVCVFRKMAGIIGNIGTFNEHLEQWSAFSECFNYFVSTLDIPGDKVVDAFLYVMCPKTFILLRDLLQPVKQGTKTYQAIVDVQTQLFLPKPFVIAKRFRFYRLKQEEGEFVTMFVSALRKLAQHCDFGPALNANLRDRQVQYVGNEAPQN